jgi:hypothetical protein
LTRALAARDALDYEGRDVRELAISNQLLDTTDETFAWIWSIPFAAWLESPFSHVFWISGKPASGKSSLMTHIAKSPRTLELSGKRIIIKHFLDFRAGEGTANNFEGFLRSLAAQIIASADKAKLNTSALLEVSRVRNVKSGFFNMPLVELRQALITVLTQGKAKLLMLLDGLDEYGGDPFSLENLIRTFAGADCLVCIASRPGNPWPTLFKTDGQIMMQEYNYDAILEYARHRLRNVSTEPDTCEHLATDVADRSVGVFLWARFAIDEMLEAVRRGLSLSSKTVQDNLDAVPEELDRIYDRRLNSLNPDDKAVACLLFLVLRSVRVERVNLAFLHKAMIHGPNDDQVPVEVSRATKAIKQGVTTLTDFMIYLNNCASCFIHSRPSRMRFWTRPETEGHLVLEFNHRTAYTYIEDKAWPQLYQVKSTSALAHLYLMLAGLNAARSTDAKDYTWNTNWVRFDGGELDPSHDTLKFIDYTASLTLEHASLYEQETGISTFHLLYN